jgi:predicted choloylglycine hydrolase
MLVRNYDYHPDKCEGLILHSRWHGTRVIAASDSLWGVLDGINEHGLAVSLAFGGRRVVGDGFGIPLILRYVLEFCRTTPDAVDVLRRVPSHMAYTVTALDADGRHATVYLNPDRPAEVSSARVATNHQRQIEWPEYAALTRTEERASHLASGLESDETPERFISRFLDEPLVSHVWDKAFGTLYTAVYRPDSRQAEYRWRDRTWPFSFERFVPAEVTVTYANV